ncbi:MAG: DNA-3-methyladenine glycosylase I [Christensenellales bacterium]|jgi:DNA-3-methyladenine glycosylase I
MAQNAKRCDWATKSRIEQEYHDHKWGIPVYDDRELFKMLLLEGMQAGLSWLVILKKMDAICAAFDDFDPEKIVAYDEEKVAELLQNEGIIRNRLKIQAASVNARAYFKLCEECGSLSNYLWGYVHHQPIINTWEHIHEVPARTDLSDTISRDLKIRGFKFVGSTIVYAFMQAVGMVNDHLVGCDFRRV